MSVNILPIYPDLFKLSADKILEIDAKCIEAKHLTEDNFLLEVVNNTLTLLKNNGLVKEDIYTNHQNMFLLFSNGGFEAVTNGEHYIHTELNSEICKRYELQQQQNFDKKNIVEHAKIKINDRILIISRLKWNYVEKCPIETYFYNSNQSVVTPDLSFEHCDWFVSDLERNIHMWIPDLVPYQIGMFGFCQGAGSMYNFDLNMYINIFNLKSNQKLLKHYYGIGWIKENKTTKERNDKPFKIKVDKLYDGNKFYSASLFNYEERTVIDVTFDDLDFIKNNREITLFGYVLKLNPYTRLGRHTYEISSHVLFLKDDC
jgi:hypothetical protein